MISEFFLVLVVRALVAGEWRGHIPGTTGIGASLGIALTVHANLMFYAAIPYRLHIGPALWAWLVAYGVVVNPAMVVWARSVNSRARTIDTIEVLIHHAHVLWAIVLLALVLVVIGWGLAWAAVCPEKRSDFFRNEPLRHYLKRKWDTRTASRARLGNGLDAARAHVVMAWSYVYWCVHACEGARETVPMT